MSEWLRSKFSDFNFEDVPFTTGITVLDSIISEEETEKLKKTVEELLDELTPRQREAIYLRYMQEMDYEEIASLLNMNSNSARRLVHRGIESLRSKTSDSKNNMILVFIILTYYSGL